MAKKEKNANTSFFIYTALIFIVAVIIVILGFLGQRHSRIAESGEDKGGTIAISAAQVSEENARLNLKITDLNGEIEALKTSVSEKDSVIDAYESLLKAQSYLDAGNIEEAKKYLSTIDAESVGGEFKNTYDNLMLRIGETE